MKDDIWYFVIIGLLLVVLIKSCDYNDSKIEAIEETHRAEFNEMREYYYGLYEDIADDYYYIYYHYEEDPGRTLSMDEFTDPDDLRFPIIDYQP